MSLTDKILQFRQHKRAIYNNNNNNNNNDNNNNNNDNDIDGDNDKGDVKLSLEMIDTII